jgi:hypothetical protein
MAAVRSRTPEQFRQIGKTSTLARRRVKGRHDSRSCLDQLAAAAQSYLIAFGHPVPEVIEMLATRPGPARIRQAVLLQRPVKAWLAVEKEILYEQV